MSRAVDERERKTKEWADKYGKSYNERRRARYHSDPLYKERAKTARMDTYYNGKNRAEGLRKEYKGKVYTVLKVGGIADRGDITVGKVQVMVGSGKIPDPVFAGVHRYYTEHQADLILWAINAVDKTPQQIADFVSKNWLKKL